MAAPITRPEAYALIDALARRHPPGAARLTAADLVDWLEGIVTRRPDASRDERRQAARVAKAVHRLGFKDYAI